MYDDAPKLITVGVQYCILTSPGSLDAGKTTRHGCRMWYEFVRGVERSILDTHDNLEDKRQKMKEGQRIWDCDTVWIIEASVSGDRTF